MKKIKVVGDFRNLKDGFSNEYNQPKEEEIPVKLFSNIYGPYIKKVKAYIGENGVGKSNLFTYQLNEIKNLERKSSSSGTPIDVHIYYTPLGRTYNFMDEGSVVDVSLNSYYESIKKNDNIVHYEVQVDSDDYGNMVADPRVNEARINQYTLVENLWSYLRLYHRDGQNTNLSYYVFKHWNLRLKIKEVNKQYVSRDNMKIFNSYFLQINERWEEYVYRNEYGTWSSIKIADLHNYFLLLYALDESHDNWKILEGKKTLTLNDWLDKFSSLRCKQLVSIFRSNRFISLFFTKVVDDNWITFNLEKVDALLLYYLIDLVLDLDAKKSISREDSIIKVELILKGEQNYDVVRLPFSSGERLRLQLFSRVLLTLRKKYYEEYREFHLYLDEIETGLHPEWQRELFNDLVVQITLLFDNICENLNIESASNDASSLSYIWNETLENKIADTSKDVKVYMSLASHTPYLVSDIPRNHVLYLKLNENGFLDEHTSRDINSNIVKDKVGFINNIHEILASSFFAGNGIYMGQFAYNIISDILKKLSNNELSIVQLTELKNVVSLIGEPAIRDNFMNEITEQLRSRNGEPI